MPQRSKRCAFPGVRLRHKHRPVQAYAAPANQQVRCSPSNSHLFVCIPHAIRGNQQARAGGRNHHLREGGRGGRLALDLRYQAGGG